MFRAKAHLLLQFYYFLFFLFANLALSGFIQANTLRVVTEHFPPFQIAPSKNEPGSGLALNIFNRLQQELGRDEKAQFFPWARAYKIALNEPNTLIFSLAKTTNRAQHFHWIGFLDVTDELCIWHLRANTLFDVERWQDSNTYSTALPIADSMQSYLENYGYSTDHNLHLVGDFAQAIQMLLLGRVDFIAAGEHSMYNTLKSLNVETTQLAAKRVKGIHPSKLGFALSQGSDERLIQQYTAAFSKVNSSIDTSLLNDYSHCY